jgi:hypothetical protein
VIRFGSSLPIVALCPDCKKPMTIVQQHAYPSLGSGAIGDFACVVCNTEDCISKNFMTTIEKKSGMVIYTDALYIFDHDKQDWEPSFARFGVTPGEGK